MPRRLTILSDLRSAQWNRDRGIAAYAQSLVLQMSRDQPEHRHLFLWDDQLPPPLRLSSPLNFSGKAAMAAVWARCSMLALMVRSSAAPCAMTAAGMVTATTEP